MDNSELHEVVSNRSYSPLVQNNARQTLVLTTRLSDKQALQDALDAYCAIYNDNADQTIINRAKDKIFVLQTSKDIKEAIRHKDVDLVKRLIKEVHKYDHDSKGEGLQANTGSKKTSIKFQLNYELQQANKFLQSRRWEELRRKKSAKQTESISMKDAIINLRSCNSPTPCVHKLLQATLLLFGEDEMSTERWANCRRLLSPSTIIGRKMLYGFDSKKECHIECVARAKELLNELDGDAIKRSSSSAACIYYYVMGVIEQYEKENALESVSPANVDKQREILKRPITARTQRERKHQAEIEKQEAKAKEMEKDWDNNCDRIMDTKAKTMREGYLNGNPSKSSVIEPME